MIDPTNLPDPVTAVHDPLQVPFAETSRPVAEAPAPVDVTVPAAQFEQEDIATQSSGSAPVAPVIAATGLAELASEVPVNEQSLDEVIYFTIL